MINNIIFKAPATRWCFTILKVNRLLRLSILLVCMAGLSACAEKIEFDLKGSGMSASVGSINWLDNERVIFVNKIGLKGRIYIWNAMTGEVAKYSDEVDSNICYSDGYILYRSRVEGDSIYYKKGRFPDEKEYLVEGDKKNKAYDKYSCLWRDKPPEHNNKKIHYLKEEHGYLYLGEKGARSNDYPVLVKPDGERFTMPFHINHYRSPNGYYPFNKAYFIWQITGPGYRWEVRKCWNAWWLYPDGRTDTLCVPLLDVVKGGSVLLYPVVNGYLYVSTGAGRGKTKGASGIYFFDKNMQFKEKLVSGLASGFAVSPNGCKAAFLLNPIINKNITLQTINMCNEK